MARTFVYVLLLLAVFFTGMTFGIKREQSPPDIGFHYNLEEEDSVEVADIVGRELVHNNYEEAVRLDVEGPSEFTQKTASVLEAGVKGFYNLVVEILYQISNLFFD